jgi:hypothetical protein
MRPLHCDAGTTRPVYILLIQVFSIADITVNMVVSTRQILACAHFATVAFLVIISSSDFATGITKIG